MTQEEIKQRGIEEKRRYNKQYKLEHKEHIREQQKEYMRRYRKTQKGKQAIRDANRRYWEKRALKALEEKRGLAE